MIITVTGANDAAVLGGTLTGAVTEDAAPSAATGQLTVTDPDTDEAVFTAQTDVAETCGTFTEGT